MSHENSSRKRSGVVRLVATMEVELDGVVRDQYLRQLSDRLDAALLRMLAEPVRIPALVGVQAGRTSPFGALDVLRSLIALVQHRAQQMRLVVEPVQLLDVADLEPAVAVPLHAIALAPDEPREHRVRVSAGLGRFLGLPADVVEVVDARPGDAEVVVRRGVHEVRRLPQAGDRSRSRNGHRSGVSTRRYV